MFLIDKPYVSNFLKKTVSENSIPVVNISDSNDIIFNDGTLILCTKEAIKKADINTRVYTNSENSIGWISKNLGFTNIPKQIDLFKDKYKFRELVSELYPDFFYTKININELDHTDINTLPMPFIIKPTVGFFSMGVYKVSNVNEWHDVKVKIRQEISNIRKQYPEEVIDFNSFIIEECIIGEEFAVDAYYDSEGNPTILNILKHPFSSDNDVSDRVYLSSQSIIKNNLEQFLDFLKDVGNLAKISNFPCHIEIRKDSKGSIIPIEINPMRFGGWCTTADFTFFSYGFNPYLYFFNQLKPDWNEILKNKDDKVYALIVLDNSTGLNTNDISAFNYKKLLSNFSNPLELRSIDFTKYPVFGFLFTETLESNMEEINKILESDLREYITLNKCLDLN